MPLLILAGGSTGNAISIEMGGHKLQIDAGVSARRIERGLTGVCREDDSVGPKESPRTLAGPKN